MMDAAAWGERARRRAAAPPICCLQTRNPRLHKHKKHTNAPPTPTLASDSSALPENFCIIESRDAVKDFASLQLDEIAASIDARRNRIFLLMEEVRRLRIQQRLKGGPDDAPPELQFADREPEQYLSALPFLPPLTDKTLNTYYTLYAAFVAGAIGFGALLAPLLEVKIGLGGELREGRGWGGVAKMRLAGSRREGGGCTSTGARDASHPT